MACFTKLCAKEASKHPAKRYNLLVPDVFPGTSPPWDAPMDGSTRRKIEKIVEYVEQNVQKAPKVSRRLWRRIQKEHERPTGAGQCKVAVHAYMALLAKGGPENAGLYATEILTHDAAVVPLLLKHSGSSQAEQAQCVLGLELLAHFINVQNAADYASGIDRWVQASAELLFRDPEGTPPFGERAGAALRVTREYVHFARRQTAPCPHLLLVEATALAWLNDLPLRSEQRSLDVDFVDRLRLGRDFTTIDTLQLAEAVLSQVALLAPDAAGGDAVVDTAMKYLSGKRAWVGESILRTRTLHVLREAFGTNEAQFVLVAGMLRHLSHDSLKASDRAALISAATEEAKQLPDACVVPAIARSHAALAPLLPESRCGQPDAAGSAAEECLRSLARQSAHPTVLLEGLTPLLEACSSATSSHSSRRLRSIHTAVTGLLSDSAEGGQAHAPTVTVDCLPAGLLNELLRLASGPSSSNTNPGPALELQTEANAFISDALSLCHDPIGAAAAEQLQDSLAAQLNPERPHTSEQLASAGNLYAVMLRHLPLGALPRSVALVVASIRRAGADPRVPHAPAILATAEFCARSACRHAGCEAPGVALEHGCVSLAEEGNGAVMVALPESGADTVADGTMDVERFIDAFVRRVALAPALAPLALDPTGLQLQRFTPVAEMADPSSDGTFGEDVCDVSSRMSEAGGLPQISELKNLIAGAASPAVPGQAPPRGPDGVAARPVGSGDRASRAASAAAASTGPCDTGSGGAVAAAGGGGGTAAVPPLSHSSGAAPAGRPGGAASGGATDRDSVLEAAAKEAAPAVASGIGRAAGAVNGGHPVAAASADGRAAPAVEGAAAVAAAGRTPHNTPSKGGPLRPSPPKVVVAPAGDAVPLGAMQLQQPSTQAGNPPPGPLATHGSRSPELGGTWAASGGVGGWTPPGTVRTSFGAPSPGEMRGTGSPVSMSGSAFGSRALDGTAARSVHVITRGDGYSAPLYVSPGRSFEAADVYGSALPPSPSALSLAGSVSSSVRRASRSSLHVLRKSPGPQDPRHSFASSHQA